MDLTLALGFYALCFAGAALVVLVAGQETMNKPLAEVEGFQETPPSSRKPPRKPPKRGRP